MIFELFQYLFYICTNDCFIERKTELLYIYPFDAEKLLEYCLKEALLLSAKRVTLFSNTKLVSAIALYRKYGFEETALPADIHYKRANIKMVKHC